MDDSFNTIRRKKAKCKEAVEAIHRFMRMNLIPIPSINQRSLVQEDLPATPEKEDEIQRRLKYVEPLNRGKEHIAKKANDLLTYAQVARMLNSELIAIIVLSKLKKWEEQIQHPEREMPPMLDTSPAQRRYLKQKEINEHTKASVAEGINKRKEARYLADTKSKYQTDLGPPQQIQDAATREAMREQTRKTIEQYKRLVGLERQRRMDKLKRQLKEALKDLDSSLPMPPPPPPLSPGKRRNVEERNKEFKSQYEELGRKRIAEAEKIPEFGDDARKTKLPRQTIPSPHSVIPTDTRVDIEKQRRDEIERYEKLGSVKKKIFDYPYYERDLRGPKLPDHALPPAQSAVTRNTNQEKLKHLKSLTQEFLRAVEDIPPPSLLPQTPKISHEQSERIRERNERLWTRNEEQGRENRLAGENIQPPKFGDTARQITLPQQTIPLTRSALPGVEPRVDLEEQRRKDIEQYKKQGAIKKRLFNQTESEGESRNAILPNNVRPSATSRREAEQPAQRRYNQLEEERELNVFVQELQTALRAPQTLPPPLPPRPTVSTAQPPPKPQQFTRSAEKRKRQNVRERNNKLMTQFEEQGQKRLGTLKSGPPKFGDNARTTTLPKQTIPPTDPANRIDIDIRKRQRDIEQYQKMGDIKKRMYDLSNYDRNLKGPRLPDHGTPLTTSSDSDIAQSAEPQRRYKTLEEQRELDNLRRQLRDAIKGAQKTVQSSPREDRDDQNDRDGDNQ